MNKRKIIIDTSTLIYFAQIRKEVDVVHYLRNLFGQVLIPMEIKTEFERGMEKEPERVWLLEKMKPDIGFYALCTKYDIIVKAMLEGVKGIDKGEAEAVAQYNDIGAYFILADDKAFAKSIKEKFPNVRIISSLHIIAMIDFNNLMENCDKLIIHLHSKLNFKSKHLRDAYLFVAKELGLDIPNKEISRKTSLSKILKNRFV